MEKLSLFSIQGRLSSFLVSKGLWFSCRYRISPLVFNSKRNTIFAHAHVIFALYSLFSNRGLENPLKLDAFIDYASENNPVENTINFFFWSLEFEHPLLTVT